MLVQPAGRAGSGKRISARELYPGWDFTFRVESLPKLFDGLPSLTQLSRSADRLCGVVGQSAGCGGASGSSNTRTSCGGLSTPFSVLWKDCSPLPFSSASRTRKPWLPSAYMSSVCASTSHSRAPRPDSVVAAAPAVAGWLAQVTPSSVQSPATRRASSVWPSVAEEEYRRRVAPTSLQPGGTGGRAKCTSARSLAFGFDSTFNVASLPKVALGAPCETQLSKSAGTGRAIRPVHCWLPPPPAGGRSDSNAPTSTPANSGRATPR